MADIRIFSFIHKLLGIFPLRYYFVWIHIHRAIMMSLKYLSKIRKKMVWHLLIVGTEM